MFKDMFKETRKKMSMTQMQFAIYLDISRSTVSEYETAARTPSLSFLRKLAKQTNTNVSLWIDDDMDFDYEPFAGLQIVADSLIKAGMIQEDGELSEDAEKYLLKMLREDIKKYIQIKN